MNSIEDKRNKLNFEIRSLLSIIDMIDGKSFKYEDYVEYTLDEEKYLDQQLNLIVEAKTRLIDIFKD